MRLQQQILLAAALSLGICAPAHAYVDPNAGGLLFQLLTPLVALTIAGLAFARRQLFRLWDVLLEGIKASAARLARALSARR
jgi:hypothetical protein